jgi:6-phosphofructokinase 1
MVSLLEGRFHPIPFKDMIDLSTGRTRVRMVDLQSDRYKIARTYMLRLKVEDFEERHVLERLAATVGLPTDEFRRQFQYLATLEEPHFRLSVAERALDPSP